MNATLPSRQQVATRIDQSLPGRRNQVPQGQLAREQKRVKRSPRQAPVRPAQVTVDGAGILRDLGKRRLSVDDLPEKIVAEVILEHLQAGRRLIRRWHRANGRRRQQDHCKDRRRARQRRRMPQEVPIAADGPYCYLSDRDLPEWQRGLSVIYPSAIFRHYTRNLPLEWEKRLDAEITEALQKARGSGKINKAIAGHLERIRQKAAEGRPPLSWRAGDQGWFFLGINPATPREVRAVAYWRARAMHYFDDPEAMDKIHDVFGISTDTFWDWHAVYRQIADDLIDQILFAELQIFRQDTQATFQRYLLTDPPKRSRRTASRRENRAR